MKILTRFGHSAGAKATAALAVAVIATGGALAGPASAATTQGWGAAGAARAVFVQTDNTSGNQVVAYHRAAGGTLTVAGTYPTGGLGGQLGGSVVDHLASQGSLAYDPEPGLLIAVNAVSSHGQRAGLGQRWHG